MNVGNTKQITKYSKLVRDEYALVTQSIESRLDYNHNMNDDLYIFLTKKRRVEKMYLYKSLIKTNYV